MSAIPASILVPVDFGETSARAVAYGGAIANACKARLILLHAEAIEAPPYFTRDQIGALERQREATRTQAERFLARFGRQHTTAPFGLVVDDRPPAESILRAAKAADLVVMGTHGRRGLTRWWLGSVAERVLREIATPLLIVHAEPLEAADSVFARVLVRAAPPEPAAMAVDLARALAAPFHGRVFESDGHPLAPMAERVAATSVAVAIPRLARSTWLSHAGEPLVRSCRRPILFVPEVAEGVSV